MRDSATSAARLAPVLLAGAVLAACATSAPTPPPNPLEMLRGWNVYVYGSDNTLVGRTVVPEHPADRDKPQEILPAIAGAFCRPVGDGEAPAVADAALATFCRSVADGTLNARVVLSPDWRAATPSHPDCFIRCVCEGYAPRFEEPVDRGRESETGACANRLNCRLECPAR